MKDRRGTAGQFTEPAVIVPGPLDTAADRAQNRAAYLSGLAEAGLRGIMSSG